LIIAQIYKNLTVKESLQLDNGFEFLFWGGNPGQDSMVAYFKPTGNNIVAYCIPNFSSGGVSEPKYFTFYLDVIQLPYHY